LSTVKSIGSNILVALLAVVLSLLALEGLVRWFALAPAPRATDSGLKSLLTFDQALETRYLPGVSTKITSPWNEYDVTYRTNRLGLRGPEIPPKQAGELRVLALGNSFVEGWGVEESQTFASVAGATLLASIKAADPSRSVSMINAGISGYGAAQVYLNAQRLIPALEPDIVVMAYIGTMVSADYKYLKIARKDGNGIAQGLSADAFLNGGTTESAKPKAGPAWMQDMSRWSALVRLIRNRFSNSAEIERIRIGEPASDLLAVYRAGVDPATMLQPTIAHIAALADLVRKRNARFVLLYVPMPFQISDQAWDQGRRAYRLSGQINDGEIPVIRSLCAAQHLDCLFPEEVLRQAVQSRGARDIYYSYDFHLTAEGNRILGSWLGTQLAGLR
jgi:hypothetical protein